jgi:hypothetical protein
MFQGGVNLRALKNPLEHSDEVFFSRLSDRRPAFGTMFE